MKDPHRLPSQRDWQTIGAASGIGCSVAVSLIVCIVGGVFLDRWLGIEPIGVLVGVALGLLSAGYSLYELATLSDPKRGVVKLKKRDGQTEVDIAAGNNTDNNTNDANRSQIK